MSPLRSQTLALRPHPSAPGEPVRAIEVGVTRDPNARLVLRYTVQADSSRLRIPAPRAVRRADGLWRHTCFEAFIAAGTASSYLELNFSPSGEWASYEFGAYRERNPSGPASASGCAPAEAPSITTQRTEQSMTLEASVELACLRHEAAVRVALAAVIEDSGGALSHWALRHPPGEPDFHHPDGFALHL